ncbi:hypothetical protein HCN44_001081 [Aphidius gifuensis]|uniref:Uncharacterized protein n=2 Tax=Aphidius gifuensis TaxID=684658 RepID=A0A834XLJ7_APHGI|nr:hypothetical protein HCN44_001081 [Aphidius gifuensis]
MIDSSIEPCHDFYQFSCGGFLKSSESTDGLSQVERLSKVDDKFLKNFKTILEQNSSIDEFKYLKLAKTLYKACNNKSTSTFFNSVKPSGGWPVLKGSQWNENAFDFNKTIFNVGNTTQWKNYFFQFELYLDDSHIIIEPYPSDLSLEDFIQGRNNSEVNAYYNTTFTSAFNLDASIYNMNYTDDLEKMIDFEIELGRARLSKEQQLNPIFDTVEMTLSDLINNYSFFNWQEYINYHRDSPVNSSTIIIIENISYMKKLQYLLKSTETKTIANYIMWKHIYSNWISAALALNEKCADFVLDKLPIAAGAIYVQYHNFPKLTNAHNHLLEISLNIKEKFNEMIEETDWMDDETKNKTKKKLKLSNNIIGYLNEFTNNSKVDEYYKNLELFDDENVFDSIGKIDLFERKYMLTYNNENIWPILGTYMIRGVAAFHPYSNSIVVSYKILTNELFDFEQPNYINYAVWGSIIGHEITHGFDISGKNFDATGRLNDYWTALSTKNFHNKSKCIIEQYENYTVPEIGLKLNGRLTQGENVADNGGLKAAYRAYEKSLNMDKRLPGLVYTPKQLFWISYANLWCNKTTPQDILSDIDDEHAPIKFRIVGTLSNMPEFAKDFNCPSGSNMNPIKKCSVW